MSPFAHSPNPCSGPPRGEIVKLSSQPAPVPVGTRLNVTSLTSGLPANPLAGSVASCAQLGIANALAGASAGAPSADADTIKKRSFLIPGFPHALRSWIRSICPSSIGAEVRQRSLMLHVDPARLECRAAIRGRMPIRTGRISFHGHVRVLVACGRILQPVRVVGVLRLLLILRDQVVLADGLLGLEVAAAVE